jgi:hypothetical protein
MSRTPRWRTILGIAGPVVLAIGVIVFIVTRFTGQGSSENAIPPGSGIVQQISEQGNPKLLTKDVRDITYKFVFSVVTGKDPGAAWPLLDPTFPGKSEFPSRKAWVAASKGEGLPVVPVSHPEGLRGPQDVRLSMGPSTPTELTVEVLAIPKGSRPEEFELGLKRRGAGDNKRWLVDYWNTRYRPGMLANPK